MDAGLNTYAYVENNSLKYIDQKGLCKCKAGGINGIGDKQSVSTSNIIGATRTITCSYECESGSGGSAVTVRATHSEYYVFGTYFDDGREGDCQGAVFESEFSYARNRLLFARTNFKKFNPENSDSQDLKDWADKNCDEC